MFYISMSHEVTEVMWLLFYDVSVKVQTGSPERTWDRKRLGSVTRSVSLLDQQDSTWLSPTAAWGPGPCPESSSRPSWADAEVWLRFRSGPIRCHNGIWQPCLRRALGIPSCPGSPMGTCIVFQSRSRTGSGGLPPPTGSAGWNPSTGSGTASWAAGRSSGSWEGSWTCPVKTYYDNKN